MRHWENLLVKFLVTTAVVWIVGAMVGRATFGAALLAGAVITVVLYFLWDLFLLPAIGNIPTAIADGLTAAVILKIMSGLLRGLALSWGDALTVGAVLILGEYFLHRWFLNKEQPGEKT